MLDSIALCLIPIFTENNKKQEFWQAPIPLATGDRSLFVTRMSALEEGPGRYAEGDSPGLDSVVGFVASVV